MINHGVHNNLCLERVKQTIGEGKMLPQSQVLVQMVGLHLVEDSKLSGTKQCDCLGPGRLG